MCLCKLCVGLQQYRLDTRQAVLCSRLGNDSIMADQQAIFDEITTDRVSQEGNANGSVRPSVRLSVRPFVSGFHSIF